MCVLFGLLLQILPPTPTYPLTGHLSQAPVDPLPTLPHLSCLWKLTKVGTPTDFFRFWLGSPPESPGSLEQMRRGIQDN